MSELYLEDLPPGRTFTSSTLGVDADWIRRFAAEYDPQPFHLDEVAARDTLFGGLAASGWHTAALTMSLLVSGELKLAGGIVGAEMHELKWPLPVRPGDVLRVESEVLEARASRSRPDRGMAKMRMTTYNQHGQAVQVVIGTLVVQCRPQLPR